MLSNVNAKQCYAMLQGGIQRIDPLSFRSRNYIFAQIASIYFNELFIMNSSFKGDTVHLIDQLELKLHIKMCFQSDPNFCVFEQNSRG